MCCSSCYKTYMKWIITAALAVGDLALVAIFALKSKRHDTGSVSGRFNFAGYKESELTRRGALWMKRSDERVIG